MTPWIQEIDAKHQLIENLLQQYNMDAIWLRRTRNIAWFTAGMDASIAVDSEMGVYSLLITPAKRTVFTDNIEARRLSAEDKIQTLGFEIEESPWFAPNKTQQLALSDLDPVIEADLQKLRCVLNSSERERYRELGRDAAEAVEQVIRVVRPGATEYQIAALLDAACREQEGVAIVNLVAADERIANFRHPLPTNRKLKNHIMVVVCMRRGGLVASATRIAYVGTIPEEILEKQRRAAAVDAAVIAATRPGRTFGAIFADIQKAYADQNEAGQWQYHHQGGLTGYQPREHIAVPDDPTIVQLHQAYAWNPSVVGAKSEDTILIAPEKNEILTAPSARWPMIEVEVNGEIISRPGILEL